ncbi:MAG: glycosyltransferase [Patescibacteria group bacterium]
MELIITIISSIAILQSIFNIHLMLNYWNKNQNDNHIKTYDLPEKLSFTTLVPAYKEEKVIAQTIDSMNRINYPRDKNQILILLREEDKQTIEIASKKIIELNVDNIKILLVNDSKRCKPNQLNWGLKISKGEIITVFDAEDEVSPELLNVVNYKFQKEKCDILQNSVQLMDYDSNWFSLLNVLEYFFWFKSSLSFFANQGLMPLGGNSVFIKKTILDKYGGWDENCLTEDADLGIRIGYNDYTISTLYDPALSTKEETPVNLSEFIRQRSRWFQGFVQILMKLDWLKIPSLRKGLIALYIVLWPIIQGLLFFYLIITIASSFILKLDVWIALLMISPVLLLIIQLFYLLYGFYSFCKDFGLKVKLIYFFNIFFLFIPYQLVLTFSIFRALFRTIKLETSWEKTLHINQHREQAKKITSI